jgi:hypothetical protein
VFACFGVATCSPINEMASTLTTHSYTGANKQSIIMVEPAWACGFTASTHLRFVAKIWWQSARVTDIGNISMSFSSWAIDSGKEKKKMAMPAAQQQVRCRLLWWHGSAQYEYWYYQYWYCECTVRLMDSRDSVRCTVGVPTQSYLPRLPRLVSITYVVKKVSLHTGKARAPAYTSYNNITSRYFNKHCAFAVSTYVCMMTRFLLSPLFV